MSESSLIKLQASRAPTLLERDSSSEICKIFKSKLFYRLFPAGASTGLKFPVCNIVKKETPAKMFFWEFYKISKNIFSLNTSRWLLFVFIGEFWEVFQKTSFIKHLISCTSCKISTTRYSKKLFHKSEAATRGVL